MKSHSWGQEDLRYYFGSAGKCVSLAATSIASNYNKDKEDECSLILNSCDFNVDYAIRLCILKSTNMKCYYLNKSKDPKQIIKSKYDYLKTKIMLSEMQAYSYGTVSELLETMEHSMPHYFRFDLFNSMTENKDTIISLHQNEIREKRSYYINTIGIAVTIALAATGFFIYPVFSTVTAVFTSLIYCTIILHFDHPVHFLNPKC